MIGRSFGPGNVQLFTPPVIGADVVDLTRYYTKTEIQALVLGMPYKESVVVATDTNFAFSGSNIQGVALSEGDRVLVKSNTDPTENGIYVYSGGSYSRAPDLAVKQIGPAVLINQIDGDGSEATAYTGLKHPFNTGDLLRIESYAGTFDGDYTVTKHGDYAVKFPHASTVVDETGEAYLLTANAIAESFAVPVERGSNGGRVFALDYEGLDEAGDPDGTSVSGGIVVGTDPIIFNVLFGMEPTLYYQKSEVDALVENAIKGILWKEAVAAATTINDVGNYGSYSSDTYTGVPNPLIIDGYNVPDGSRVLVKNQGTWANGWTSSENGIYVYDSSSNTLTRSEDLDGIVTSVDGGGTSAPGEYSNGVAVAVQQGNVNSGLIMKLNVISSGAPAVHNWTFIAKSQRQFTRKYDPEYIDSGHFSAGVFQVHYETGFNLFARCVSSRKTVKLPQIQPNSLIDNGWPITVFSDPTSTHPLDVEDYSGAVLVTLDPGETAFFAAFGGASGTGDDRWLVSTRLQNDVIALKNVDLSSMVVSDSLELFRSSNTGDLFIGDTLYVDVKTVVGAPSVDPVLRFESGGNPVFETYTVDSSKALQKIDVAAEPAKINGATPLLAVCDTAQSGATSFVVDFYFKPLKLF
jgi:hypothetical protein